MKIYVCGGPNQASWVGAMLVDLTTALNESGYPSTYVSLTAARASAFSDALGSDRDHGRRVGVFSVNRLPSAVPEVGSRVPHFIWLVDHPVHHPAAVTGAGGNTVFGTIDDRHLATLHRFFRRAPGSVFLPHAGPEPMASPRPMAERDIDMLFIGDLGINPSPEKSVEHFASSKIVKDIFVRAAHRCIETDEICLDAVVAACGEFNVDPADIGFMHLCRMATAVENCAQAHFRHRCLGSVTSGTVHVVGPATPSWFANRDHLVFLGIRREFHEVQALMDRSRLALNLAPKFAGGSHERVCYALARGCGIVSTASHYLEADFPDGRSFFYVRGDDSLDPILDVAHNDPARIERMRAESRETYRARHRWKARVPVLVEAFENAFARPAS